MIKLIAKVQAFIEAKDGATAIEYGLIAGGISLAIVAAVFTFGDDLASIFGKMETAMENASARVNTTAQ